MSLIKYLNPNAIKDGSIEGIKIKDGSIEATKIKDGAISVSKIDETIASKSYVDDIASRNKGLITELATAGNGYNVKLDWSPDTDNENTIDPAYRGQVNLGAGCTTSMAWAYAEGCDNTASGNTSHVEGALNTASNVTSHAEGQKNTASGNASHAEGYKNTASGNYSHAEGSDTIASGSASHSEGGMNVASGNYSHAEGSDTIASGNSSSSAIGAWGINLKLTGEANATVYLCNILEIDVDNPDYLSYIIGPNNYGYITNVETKLIRPIKIKSVDVSAGTVEVESTLSNRTALNNVKCGVSATIACGNYSFAARGISAGGSSWTVNRGGFAKGTSSFVGGNCNSAYNDSEVAFGHFNKSIESTDTAIAPIASIGIGVDKDHRKNAYEIKQNGDAYLIDIGGYDGTNSDSATRLQDAIASKEYVADTIAAAITASDAMVFKGTLGTGGTTESIPSTAIVGDTYKVISLTTIPLESSYTGAEETAKAGDLVVAISADPKWVVVPSGDDEIKTLVQSITWGELKAKRDTGELIPGMQYRITDYTCTTTQSNTRSAGHQFDIIVTADTVNTLNEVARAVKHDGDEYFANNDLSAWKIWYCLDNDATRFAWADGTNGKGVIYRMIDEWNNDIPYDFKNIQFKHPNDTTTYPHYYYTFASDNVENNTDFSLDIANSCYSNTIMEYINENIRSLNQIVFIGAMCYSNSFAENCFNNSFDAMCMFNSFGPHCSSNRIGQYCMNNSFSVFCLSNSIGTDCQSNIFGFSCSENVLGTSCSHNTFHSNCTNNSFVENCCGNTFEDTCSYNTFDTGCYGNSFGSSSSNNTFGESCSYNSLGNKCNQITAGMHCDYNSFGNNCNYIKFAPDSSATTKYNYYWHNHFGDGCEYILLKGVETSSTYVQNYNFAQGLLGTSSAYLTVDGIRNRAFETKVAQNSNGELKIYCEADLIK